MYMINVREQNKQVYNRIAEFFSKTRSFLWDDLRTPLFTKYVQPGCRVLDVGCGNGRLSQLFDERVDYVGVDQSESLIALARKKFSHRQFVVEDMEHLSFPKSSFDFIYCIAAFHHLATRDEQVQTLTRMKDILRPGGRMFMLNWNLHGEWAKKNIERGKWRHADQEQVIVVPWSTGKEAVGDRLYYAFTLEEIAGLGREVGLRVEENFYIRKGVLSTMEEGENICTVFFAP